VKLEQRASLFRFGRTRPIQAGFKGSRARLLTPRFEAMFAFISKRLKDETTGYVCTGYFGTASINDGPLDPDEDLDWD
jgi:hypothetical protein